ncbi:cytochrome C biogenesis protein [Ventosimonas gracilis]|uniref:Cytochrome C biogenesis protein n=1 Tax=Ventosimonas gracilis TaxID=1680762 RepID=A0A139SUV8_9GAMM|nr:cytochrome c biogenesis protein DipZ [Ventosimonas gracilis]KXU38349.1 cytochrome C biogenesis protein [Ventosimonas gracilis]
MLLFIFAYLGGVLTMLSPCILPVLPFVFTRAGQPFMRSGLPMLMGMAASFALVASLATVAGGWVVAVNDYGRLAAMVLLAGFGVLLLWPGLAARLAAPVAALGGRLSAKSAKTDGGGVGSSALLGVATGLLWVPCAGPVLGLILTGAALNGPNVNTSLLLLTYALGAATSLALALLVGGKVFAAMKRALGLGEWMRRSMGALVLVAVGAIALGLDTGLLTQLSLASTNAIEQRLLDGLKPMPVEPSAENPASPAMMAANPAMMMSANPAMMAADPALAENAALAVEGTLPPLDGVTQWLNSPPLTVESLRGKVVLIDFWTYSCINCLRAIPHVRAWAEKYKDQGLVVIGVHTPEFAFERKISNVERAIASQKITYPVAVDNSYAVWRAFNNQYWPAHYFIDAKGQIRHHQFGEGEYEQSERIIQQLLREAGQSDVADDVITIVATGAEAAPDFQNVLSPETYLGFQRARNFISPGGFMRGGIKHYTTDEPRLNEWGLSGQWQVGEEHASLKSSQGGITFRFHARDLHLVLGPGEGGKPVRFKVTIDGVPPGVVHGVDINAEGEGVVQEERLYQLIRQNDGSIGEHRFDIQFLDPGVQAYAFTFG